MRTESAIAEGNASNSAAKFGRVAASNCIQLAAANGPGRFLPSVRAVMQKVQDLWKTKPTAQLAYLTGAPERTCRTWLNSPDRDVPGSTIVAVLHTEHGYTFLTEIMRDTDTKWWPKIDEWRRKAARLDQFVTSAQTEFDFSK